jgi:hypothetical protein
MRAAGCTLATRVAVVVGGRITYRLGRIVQATL